MKFLIRRETIYNGHLYHKGDTLEGNRDFIQPLIEVGVGEVTEWDEEKPAKKTTKKTTK